MVVDESLPSGANQDPGALSEGAEPRIPEALRRQLDDVERRHSGGLADMGSVAVGPPDVEAVDERHLPAAVTARPAAANLGSLGEIGLNPRYTFDDFVIGESNRFAAAAALAVAERPAGAYNPLFIYGDAGLGKTHLLHAIGHYIRKQDPNMIVRYVSMEHFLNDFIEAIRTNSQGAFKLRYRMCDVLLVDDVQLIENKATTQEEFFHTFDYLHSSGRQIVISSDRPPKAMATLEDRLRSRFGWGLITDVQPPGLETRLDILRKKAGGETGVAPDDVLTYIATHITSNVRELEGALTQVLAFSSLNRVPLDLGMVEDVLRDLITEKAPRQITAKLVIEATADLFGLTIEELTGKSRSRPLVTARQIAMYVLREMTDFSYPAIGRAFGDRDHTTVMHAVSKITELMRERRTTYEQVTELMHRIRQSEAGTSAARSTKTSPLPPPNPPIPRQTISGTPPNYPRTPRPPKQEQKPGTIRDLTTWGLAMGVDDAGHPRVYIGGERLDDLSPDAKTILTSVLVDNKGDVVDGSKKRALSSLVTGLAKANGIDWQSAYLLLNPVLEEIREALRARGLERYMSQVSPGGTTYLRFEGVIEGM